MTPLQEKLYRHFMQSRDIVELLDNGKKSVQVLPLICALKNLANHPKLVYDARKSGKASAFKTVEKLFPPEFVANPSDPAFSGKVGCLVAPHLAYACPNFVCVCALRWTPSTASFAPCA